MEIWRDRRLLLEELQKRTQDSLTAGQAVSLTKLIQETQVAETGFPINPGGIRKLAKGLLVGQHLEEPELVEFLSQVTPQRVKRR